MTRTHYRPLLWTITLAATAVLGSLAAACLMPFVAVATLAAATLPRRQAVIAVLGAWAANQLIGFGLLGFPMTGYAIGWGLALGAASLAVLPLARRLAGPSAVRLALGFAAGFVLWEVLLFGFALAAGGLGTFTPAIVFALFANEAMWFALLAALHVIATRSAPRLFGAPRIVRFG